MFTQQTEQQSTNSCLFINKRILCLLDSKYLFTTYIKYMIRFDIAV